MRSNPVLQRIEAVQRTTAATTPVIIGVGRKTPSNHTIQTLENTESVMIHSLHPKNPLFTTLPNINPSLLRIKGTAFLSCEHHRIRFVYIPKHTSWLNQIELWFSILARRLLKRASFTSIEQLSERILAFIQYFNQTLAKPFRWTYKRRPLTV